MKKDESLQAMIQELAGKYSELGEKVLVLQASEVVVCCGVYNNGLMVHSAILLYNKPLKKWEIVDGEPSKETTSLYFAYFGSLLELIEDRLGTSKEEFGIDIYDDFIE